MKSKHITQWQKRLAKWKKNRQPSKPQVSFPEFKLSQEEIDAYRKSAQEQMSRELSEFTPEMYAQVAAEAETNKGEWGAINGYVCENCPHKMVTIDREAGVTPFMMPCENCKGWMRSSMYRVPQNLTPTHEFFRPSYEMLKTLTPGLFDHVKKGGLAFRKIGELEPRQ